MKKDLLVRNVLAIALVGGFALSITGCKNDGSKDTTKSESSSEITTTTTESTTSLPDFSGPLPSNTVAISWQETTIEQTVRYAYVSTGNYLRVRSGPGQDYDIVGTLTSDMEVIVVAVTDSGWYKTVDGFYVSGDFVTETPSSASLN